MRGVLMYAIRRRWLERNPFTQGDETLIPMAEEESRDRIPSPEEEAAILAQCVGPRAHLRPMLITLKDTGLRKGAMLALTWKSVDFEEGLVEIPKGKANKGRPKFVGMTARLRAELLALWEESDKKPESKIFRQGDFRKAYATACRYARSRGETCQTVPSTWTPPTASPTPTATGSDGLPTPSPTTPTLPGPSSSPTIPPPR